MADVANAEGLEPSMGQSPFALGRGTQFERGLFAENGKKLIDALIESDVLPAGASGLLDVRLRLNGGPLTSQREALERTHALVTKAAALGAAGLPKLPALVASATLEIPGQPVMLPDGILAIDALVLRAKGKLVELVIGEIKTYPDRAGHTDPADLATSRAQAGLYLHALTLLIDQLGLSDRLSISSTGFLVLTKTGRNDPSIRPNEDLQWQARRAKRGFVHLRAAAEKLDPFDPADEESGIKAVLAADTCYRSSCLGFCDRAVGCRRAAEANGDPSVLGDDVKRFLGPTLLPRAIELLHGAKPATAAEEDLTQRMHDAGGGQ